MTELQGLESPRIKCWQAQRDRDKHVSSVKGKFKPSADGVDLGDEGQMTALGDTHDHRVTLCEEFVLLELIDICLAKGTFMAVGASYYPAAGGVMSMLSRRDPSGVDRGLLSVIR